MPSPGAILVPLARVDHSPQRITPDPVILEKVAVRNDGHSDALLLLYDSTAWRYLKQNDVAKPRLSLTVPGRQEIQKEIAEVFPDGLSVLVATDETGVHAANGAWVSGSFWVSRAK